MHHIGGKTLQFRLRFPKTPGRAESPSLSDFHSSCLFHTPPRSTRSHVPNLSRSPSNPLLPHHRDRRNSYHISENPLPHHPAVTARTFAKAPLPPAYPPFP